MEPEGKEENNTKSEIIKMWDSPKKHASVYMPQIVILDNNLEIIDIYYIHYLSNKKISRTKMENMFYKEMGEIKGLCSDVDEFAAFDYLLFEYGNFPEGKTEGLFAINNEGEFLFIKTRNLGAILIRNLLTLNTNSGYQLRYDINNSLESHFDIIYKSKDFNMNRRLAKIESMIEELSDEVRNIKSIISPLRDSYDY
jgi:hypothetical protein